MKETRSQKKRKVNDAVVQLNQLREYYTDLVNGYFLFSEWIEAMTPKYEDSRLDGAVKLFIVQTMIYLNVFMREYNGNKCLIFDKQEFVDALKSNPIYDQIVYDETFTKESIMSILDNCADKFFNNTIFTVVDKKDVKIEQEKVDE